MSAYRDLGLKLATLVVVVATSACATAADAQRAAPTFRRNPDDCFKYPMVLPGDQLRTIADSCETQFKTARKFPDELANAGLNSGIAHNQLNEFAQAAAVLERVTQDTRASATSREAAKFQLALAFVGQGSLLKPGAERATLLGKAITSLDEILASPNSARGTPGYTSAMFQRAKAYQQRASGTLDFNNAIDGFAVVADSGAGVDASLRDEARRSLIDVAIVAGANEMKSGGGDTAAAQRAAGLYEKALRFDPTNLDLNIGLGDARLTIARSAGAVDRAGWFERARRAYQVALDSAPTGSAAIAASVGNARALRGLGQLREAIDAYKAARVAGATSNFVVSELAFTQVEFAASLQDGPDRQTAFRDAEQSFRTMLQQPGIGASDRASILMTLANVQEQQPGRTADVQATLLEAMAADPTSTRPALQIGMNYYAQSAYGDAAGYFQKVISQTGGAGGAPGPGQTEPRALAYYYLSLINDQRGAAAGAAALRAGVENADAAIGLGMSKSPYREQACVARILRGGTSVTTRDSSTACSVGEQPNGMLLLGLFNLRKARFVSTTLRPAALELAQVWFDQGLREIDRTNGVTGAEGIVWPGLTSPPSVRDMLQYGKAKVVSCSGLSIDANLSLEQIQRAEAFFEFYGVNDCAPVR
jgi:tetratricopeptide (TPR) repeat protein